MELHVQPQSTQRANRRYQVRKGRKAGIGIPCPFLCALCVVQAIPSLYLCVLCGKKTGRHRTLRVNKPVSVKKQWNVKTLLFYYKFDGMGEVFLVHITLPEVFTAEIYELLPQQRALINSLMERRVILSYSLDMARKYVWAFIEARNQKHLKRILATFPIIAHVGINIHELAYHDAAPVSLPDLIMN